MVSFGGPGPAGVERGVLRAIAVAAGGLAVATGAAAVLEGVAGIADASPVYLVAVVVVAGVAGTWAAIGTSVAAFLVYDFLFTQPRFTLAIADPAEWLSLVLFLLVAVAIGRLTALLRERADEAERRVREGVALVAMARESASAPTFGAAATSIAARLRDDAEMDAVAVELDGAIVATAGERPTAARGPWTLVRDAAGGGADWVAVDPAAGPPDAADAYRVPVEAGGPTAGAIVAWRAAGAPVPGRGARRLLSLAADELGSALLRERLRDEATSAEVARRGDALRGAILDSVSHDLRTPLAAIRALAGRLADPGVRTTDADGRGIASSIDREAERLAGLVGALLDMSRIQAEALRPSPEPYDLAELVETAVARVTGARAAAGAPGAADDAGRIGLELPPDLPPVLADAVLFDVAFGNVLDNALRHAPPPARVRVTAAVAADGGLEVDVDDAGPGVPADALPHLFDRFYRIDTAHDPARPGIGMGLAIARGFVEAMGGSIEAGPSALGGLRVGIILPAAPEPVR